ncbi:MAG: glycosyltransferase [Balneola sp.]|nr:glycosyltransferase [Balneola sp.]MBO6651551.1 glycosyltransferase [Balneola sp.]MBO6710904.1 glycosyltransferase [Balneola sp.]MBO6799592.1 glycosyltransferase [Balneola sp.]MBO6870324.1 glycosyltransferase [Balneola sp.]
MPPKRNVALFSTSFLPYSQTFIYDEIRAHSDNYEITVFCKDRQNEERFPYEKFHKPGGKLSEIIYQNIAYWPSFNKIIGNGNFDLIHAHFGTGAVYSLPYVKKFKIPFVVTFHGNDVAALMGTQKYKSNRWRYYSKHKQIFEHATLLLAASEELRALLIELGADPSKVKVYHLGIDLSKFEYQEPEPRGKTKFVMIGRFTPKKAHIYVLRAFEKLIKDGLNASLTFIGSGELKNEAINFVEENDLSSAVDFKGILTPDEVSEVLKSSDVLVAPSIVAFDQDRESGLIVVKEAGGVGIPAIGTWHGGIHEIIEDGKTGFLIPERNVPELIKKMKLFIEQPELIKTFGAASRKKMEKDYNLFSQVKKLEAFYEEAINEHERI